MLWGHHHPGYTLLIIARRVSRFEKIGGNRPRVHSRDDNSTLPQLLTERICESEYSMFGSRIGYGLGCAYLPCHGSHIYNLAASPLQHMWNNSLRAPDNPHVVNIHHIVKFMRLHLRKSSKFAVPCVI